jgi:2-iminobutanoate/2-iminopropanoate deaminase
MTNLKTIIRPAKAAPPVGPYNHAVRAGNLLFCSGQIPIDAANPTAPFPEDIQAQTTRVLENIRAILEDQALGFADVIKATVFMTNLGDFARMNEVYSRFFTSEFPARSTIQVAALPRGASIEIEVIALYPN